MTAEELEQMQKHNVKAASGLNSLNTPDINLMPQKSQKEQTKESSIKDKVVGGLKETANDVKNEFVKLKDSHDIKSLEQLQKLYEDNYGILKDDAEAKAAYQEASRKLEQLKAKYNPDIADKNAGINFDMDKVDNYSLNDIEAWHNQGLITDEAYEKALNIKNNTPQDIKDKQEIGEKAAEETLNTDTNTSNAIPDGDVTPVESDVETTTEDQKQKKRYEKSMYGILDAMKNGDIDTSTGIYFMLDALSKAAKNTGVDIGNIGAQFTGGTINNNKEQSLWEQRRNKMFENQLQAETESEEGSPAWRAAQHDFNALTTEQQEIFANDIDNWIKENIKELSVADADTRNKMLQKQLEAMGYKNLQLQGDTDLFADVINNYIQGNSGSALMGAKIRNWLTSGNIGATVNAGPVGLSF